jgi:hypothetical protein
MGGLSGFTELLAFVGSPLAVFLLLIAVYILQSQVKANTKELNKIQTELEQDYVRKDVYEEKHTNMKEDIRELFRKVNERHR